MTAGYTVGEIPEIINNSLALCTFNKFESWKFIMENSWIKTTLIEIFSGNSYPCCRKLHLTVTRPDGYRHLLYVRVTGIITYFFLFLYVANWSVLGVMVEFLRPSGWKRAEIHLKLEILVTKLIRMQLPEVPWENKAGEWLIILVNQNLL